MAAVRVTTRELPLLSAHKLYHKGLICTDKGHWARDLEEETRPEIERHSYMGAKHMDKPHRMSR
jgi:hypothetical protein